MQSGTFEYGNSVLASGVTATAQGIIADCQRYNRICFAISGLTVETISVVPSFDYSSTSGTGTFEANAMRPIDCSTGALAAASALGNGTYMFVNTPWRALKFTKSATTDGPTIRYGILNAN